jgi:hypothetical protein
VRTAIEQAIVDLINQGEAKELWKFKGKTETVPETENTKGAIHDE